MKNNKWMAEHIIDHLTNGENGEITDPMLEEWLGESTSNRREFAYYQRIWKESASCLRKEAVNVELAWEKIDASNRKDALRRMRLIRIGYVISGIAASLLIVLALSTIGVFDRKTDLLVRMSTGYGNRSEVVLPDGSVVKLNSGSELVYTYDADKKTREVHFQGEGFFDVAKDKDKPFVIRMADSLRLCVHGTSFNLRAYADEEMAAQFADAARQAAEYRRSHPRGKVWSPEGFASRACVRRFEEIDSGIYFYQFDDYSGGLVNALGQTLDTSISDYEFILDMRVLGKLNGITHYAVKCAYSSRTPVEYVIFSIKGNAVLLPGNGIRNADSLDRIYDEFQKLARKGPGSRDAVRSKAAERCRNSQANSISNKGIRR